MGVLAPNGCAFPESGFKVSADMGVNGYDQEKNQENQIKHQKKLLRQPSALLTAKISTSVHVPSSGRELTRQL